jgi:hypothetical protein
MCLWMFRVYGLLQAHVRTAGGEGLAATEQALQQRGCVELLVAPGKALPTLAKRCGLGLPMCHTHADTHTHTHTHADTHTYTYMYTYNTHRHTHTQHTDTHTHTTHTHANRDMNTYRHTHREHERKLCERQAIGVAAGRLPDRNTHVLTHPLRERERQRVSSDSCRRLSRRWAPQINVSARTRCTPAGQARACAAARPGPQRACLRAAPGGHGGCQWPQASCAKDGKRRRVWQQGPRA